VAIDYRKELLKLDKKIDQLNDFVLRGDGQNMKPENRLRIYAKLGELYVYREELLEEIASGLEAA
jgi:hypothetical protein